MQKKVLLVVAVAILITLGGIFLLLNKDVQKPYIFLEEAASSRLSMKGDYRIGNADCYPADTNKTSCPAITYIVDKQTCLDALRLSDSGAASDKESECKALRRTFTYKGKNIYSYIGKGNGNEYWVQLRLESDL